MTSPNPALVSDVEMRRTFAIISHPDAGKTTLTFGFADDRVVRGHDGSRHHMGDDLHVAVNIVLFDVRQRPDGDGGGGVAAVGCGRIGAAAASGQAECEGAGEQGC